MNFFFSFQLFFFFSSLIHTRLGADSRYWRVLFKKNSIEYYFRNRTFRPAAKSLSMWRAASRDCVYGDFSPLTQNFWSNPNNWNAKLFLDIFLSFFREFKISLFNLHFRSMNRTLVRIISQFSVRRQCWEHLWIEFSRARAVFR